QGKSAEQVAVAEKKAKELAVRAQKGEKFTDLARDNSDDVETAKNGGQIGPMTKGPLDKADRRPGVRAEEGLRQRSHPPAEFLPDSQSGRALRSRTGSLRGSEE